LKLEYDEPRSKFASKFNLRRYIQTPLLSTTIAPTTADGDLVLALDDEQQFFWKLDEGLRRIVAFYGDRLEQAGLVGPSKGR